jgi:hypothetical protein
MDDCASIMMGNQEYVATNSARDLAESAYRLVAKEDDSQRKRDALAYLGAAIKSLSD